MSFVLTTYDRLKIQKFSRNLWATSQKFRHHNQKGYIKQFPYWGPKNFMRRRTKFGRHGEVASGIYEPLP
jgi:hypothetical protein